MRKRDIGLLAVSGRVKDGKKDQADIDLSKDLCRQAGVNPKSITAKIVVSNSFFTDLSEAMQAAMAASGINADLQLGPSASNFLLYQQGAYDVTWHVGFTYDDPSDFVPKYALTNGSQNYGKWQRPQIDALYDQQDKELDPAKRKQIVYQFQRALLDEAVVWPLASSPSVYGTHAEVFGYVTPGFGTSAAFRLERVWLER